MFGTVLLTSSYDQDKCGNTVTFGIILILWLRNMKISIEFQNTIPNLQDRKLRSSSLCFHISVF